jgi:hypothetical protein
MKDILLKKPKARTSILFKPDKEDDWFVNVIHFENKSGKETTRSLIIQKDVQSWLDNLLRRGWVISDDKPVSIVSSKTIKKKKKEDQDDESPF